jgi:hypothetical protein
LLFPHGIDHRVRSQVDHVPNKLVRMLRPDAVAAEDGIRKIAPVASNDNVGAADNRRRQDVPVIGIGSVRARSEPRN